MPRQPNSTNTGDRAIRYRQIAGVLRDRIRSGELASGSLLPSEAELSDSFDASRVTVRSALHVLRDEGLVHSRQGLGWTVSAAPLRQSLDQLGTMEAMIEAAGRDGERRILDFGFREVAGPITELLGGGRPLVVTRLNLLDDRPFALVTVWCPEHYGSGLTARDVEQSTFLELLPVTLGGATQVIGAGGATGHEASLLEIDQGVPVLRVRRVTRSSSGEVVLVSEHVFPADRTEFVAELSVRAGPVLEAAFRFVENGDDPPRIRPAST